MDGKGREGTYIFSHDDWGQPGEGQGIGYRGQLPPSCHPADAAHVCRCSIYALLNSHKLRLYVTSSFSNKHILLRWLNYAYNSIPSDLKYKNYFKLIHIHNKTHHITQNYTYNIQIWKPMLRCCAWSYKRALAYPENKGLGVKPINNNNNNNTQDDIYNTIIYGAKPYVRVHFGSSEWKSVSVRWPPTRRRSWNFDLWVRL